MKRVCTINARGGSKGIKNKNIRMLCGKPLIAHSIIQAKESNLFACVAVSSDSDEILDIASEFGIDYLIKRPIELATDHSPKLPAIQHSVLEAEKLRRERFDVIVDLDATSPLRTIEDIAGAIRLLEKKCASNIITGTPARRSPYFNLVEINDEGFVRLSKTLGTTIVRRQDCPECFDLNASIYVWSREQLFASDSVLLEDTMLYVMPPERSIDIDSDFDFEIVEFLMKRSAKSEK